MAKKWEKEKFLTPCLKTRAGIAEGYLPLITANLTLQGLDAPFSFPKFELNDVEFVWDTRTHRTIIVEDLLSEDFREYLRHPIHDLYRSEDGLCLQMECEIALTNSPVSISAVVLVVPKSKMPNTWVGALFGQSM
jgi:hypothetical protein